jgi:hypothetical protein
MCRRQIAAGGRDATRVACHRRFSITRAGARFAVSDPALLGVKADGGHPRRSRHRLGHGTDAPQPVRLLSRRPNRDLGRRPTGSRAGGNHRHAVAGDADAAAVSALIMLAGIQAILINLPGEPLFRRHRARWPRHGAARTRRRCTRHRRDRLLLRRHGGDLRDRLSRPAARQSGAQFSGGALLASFAAYAVEKRLSPVAWSSAPVPSKGSPRLMRRTMRANKRPSSPC